MSVIAARPVVTRIGDAIYQRLLLLAAGAESTFKASEVIRPKARDEYTPKDKQIALTRGACPRVPELDCPGNPPAEAYRARFDIRCHIVPSEKDNTPLDEYVDVAAAAVSRIICSESTRWFTFGELAIDAVFGSHDRLTRDGVFAGVNIPLDVVYRVTEGDPYETRA